MHTHTDPTVLATHIIHRHCCSARFYLHRLDMITANAKYFALSVNSTMHHVHKCVYVCECVSGLGRVGFQHKCRVGLRDWDVRDAACAMRGIVLVWSASRACAETCMQLRDVRMRTIRNGRTYWHQDKDVGWCGARARLVFREFRMCLLMWPRTVLVMNYVWMGFAFWASYLIVFTKYPK